VSRRSAAAALLPLSLLLVSGFVASGSALPARAHDVAARKVPRPAHTIVVILENHSYSDIIGNKSAPYLNSLAAEGALFTRSFAITHPSEPNYLALFSGSTHRVTSDSCPHTFTGRNLGSELRAAKDTFAGYSESLPATGYTGCSHGLYARKHNPWVNFSDLPRSVNRPFTSFPAHFSALPTLSFVVPNLNHDMHNGTIAEADRWLKQHLGKYVLAARRGHGLLVVTWDEGDYGVPNQIPTIMVGADVRPGRYAERIDDYRVLRTLEAAYNLKPLGLSASRAPITNIWK
jgi:hypothetical protein